MKVQAIKMGFYGGARVRPGAVIDVPDDFKASWLVPVRETLKGPSKRQEPVALSQMGQQQARTFNQVVGKGADLTS